MSWYYSIRLHSLTIMDTSESRTIYSDGVSRLKKKKIKTEQNRNVGEIWSTLEGKHLPERNTVDVVPRFPHLSSFIFWFKHIESYLWGSNHEGSNQLAAQFYAITLNFSN